MTPSWAQLVINHRDNPIFRSRTCCTYSRHSKQPPNNPNRECPCGRLISRHSFDGTYLKSQILDKSETSIPPKELVDNKINSCSVPVNIFGTLKPHGCNFLRVDNRFNTNNLNELYHLYRLILEDCGGKRPGLIFSICGGAKYFTLTDQLQTEVVRDIIDIAARAGN